MKRMSAIMMAAIALSGCSKPPQVTTQAKAAPESEPLRATRWTAKGELFVEYPALVAGQKGRFAIHLTRLSDFRAVKDATCEVELMRAAAPEAFPCDPSTRP